MVANNGSKRIKGSWKIWVAVLVFILIGSGVGLASYNAKTKEKERIEAAKREEAKRKAESDKLQKAFNSFAETQTQLLDCPRPQ